jgi:hypothetical protein
LGPLFHKCVRKIFGRISVSHPDRNH